MIKCIKKQQSDFYFILSYSGTAFQLLVQDLHRGDITVAAFNDLSNKLLREYREDDTRRVKETTDQMNTCWVNLNQR